MPPIKLEEKNISLLVLPPLPTPLKRASLWSAYKATFETLLPKVLPQNKQYVSRLDVAVSLPSTRPNAPRTAHYPGDQLVFQEIYTLVCLAAARTNVELDFPGGVDVRVFLVQNSPSSSGSLQSSSQWLAGPIVDVNTLVTSSREYSTIYGVEGEQGESVLQALLSAFRNNRKSSAAVYRLPSGPLMTTATSTNTVVTNEKEVQIHHNVINGGTFDHLHLGHKLLLTATVYLSDPSSGSKSTNTTATSRNITIGTTGDELLVNKKHPEQLEPWDIRQQRTHEFIDSILQFAPAAHSDRLSIHTERINNPGPNGKIVRVTYSLRPDPNQPDLENQVVTINYTQIADPYGPTITVEDLSAIIISAETRAGGKAVNDKRREKGWKELEVFEVGVLDANVNEDEIEVTEKEGFDGKLSSTGMRQRLAELERGSIGINGGEKL